MKSYREMTKEELKNELSELKAQYRKFQEMDLALDMSRGKPCREQLDLSYQADTWGQCLLQHLEEGDCTA